MYLFNHALQDLILSTYMKELFCRYPDDNSALSKKCARWGNYGTGVWGRGRELRLADHTMYVASQNHWLLRQDQNRYDCDDLYGAFSTEDFWNVYVR